MVELRHVKNMGKMLASQQRTNDWRIDTQTLAQTLRDRLRHAAYRRRAEMRPVAQKQRSVIAVAEPVRLFQYRVEHRGEVAGRAVDDAQHLGGRGLLLQCLARLGQQPRVLHRDHCLCREILQQCDLLCSKRPDFLTVNGDDAEESVTVAESRGDVAADPADVHQCPRGWRTEAVCVLVHQIDRTNNLLAPNKALGQATWSWSRRRQRCLKLGRKALRSDALERLTVTAQHVSESSATKV